TRLARLRHGINDSANSAIPASAGAAGRARRARANPLECRAPRTRRRRRGHARRARRREWARTSPFQPAPRYTYLIYPSLVFCGADFIAQTRRTILRIRAQRAGNQIVATAPRPTRFARLRRPPCASTISRQSVSPSPVPVGFVEKNG